jgi:hypothetical protein
VVIFGAEGGKQLVDFLPELGSSLDLDEYLALGGHQKGLRNSRYL